ncbi:DUF3899 domain-containing protein [Carnobacterium gallinarum]|uniref:DUF3899 domain-containing protein n=1 Tax=Carnobacterium gallinarum TaxID=2749 RepID=UPI000555C159|nr:DUF3899 domain-containing protein [Carnobacterium gallinarum]
MKYSKKITLLIGLPLLFTLLWQLVQFQKVTFLETSNLCFLFAGILLIIGLFWYTLSSGVFDFFNFSMKKSAHIIKGGSEKLEVKPLSKSVGTGYKTVLLAGTILLGISILSLVGFYL